MLDPTGPHKLKAKRYEPQRYRLNPALYHTFDQVAGVLWMSPGHRVELKTKGRKTPFWAQVEHHPQQPGESIIRLPWLAYIDKKSWGYSTVEGKRIWIKNHSYALDDWALRFYGAPNRNGYLIALTRSDVPIPLRHLLYEPQEP